MRVEITELPKWRDIVTVNNMGEFLKNPNLYALEMHVNGTKIILYYLWAVFTEKEGVRKH
jgi:hypothetical protein